MAILDAFGKAPGGLLANGLAFSTLFASIPTLLLALGLAGLIARDDDSRQEDDRCAHRGVPAAGDVIESSVVAASEGAAVAGLIGLVGVIWTVSQLYVTLDVAFARIFSAMPERDLFRRTARGFIWVALLAALIIGLIVLRAVATALDTLLPGTFPFAGTVLGIVSSQGFLLAATIVGVGLVYRVMPPRPPSIRTLAPPAIVAGLAMWFLTQAFTFLAPRLVGVGRPGGFARDRVHRAGVAVVPVPGAALRRRVGEGPRGRARRAVRRPGRSRTGGRTGRWRRVTDRS